MTQLLKRAFAEAAKLPEPEQDTVASVLLAELQSERGWAQTFAASQDELSQLAEEALREFEAGETLPLDPARDFRELPEFRVTLTRLEPGETAYSPDDHYLRGQRTKLGGKPDWDQGDNCPICAGCEQPMSFVAQIDSVEHEWPTNPHSREAGRKHQKWMFGDVGMIYVFFCFDCLQSKSVFQCG